MPGVGRGHEHHDFAGGDLRLPIALLDLPARYTQRSTRRCAMPGTPSIVLVIGSEAPASAEILPVRIQHPLDVADVADETHRHLGNGMGVAWLGVGPTKWG